MLNFRGSSSIEESSTSLPERWKRGRRRAALACLAAVMLFSGAFTPQSGADATDTFWLCARFGLREKFLGPQRDPRIVLVGLDDKSLSLWPKPFIMWGGYMADAITQLHRSGARVIALDWMQAIETDALLHHDNDQRLSQAISQAGNVVAVKFIKPGGGYVLPAPSVRYALLPDAYVDEGHRSLGYAEVNSSSSILTTIYPSIATPQGREVSFALRIAEKSGLLSPQTPILDEPLLINYGNGAGQRGPNSTFEWVSFYDVATGKVPDSRFKGKIVLIGSADKGNQDEHYVPFFTPPSSFTKLLDGVEVQAHAVRTLLDKSEIREPHPLLAWSAAVLLGLVGVGAFARWNWGRASLAVVGTIVCWAAVSFFFFCSYNFHLPLTIPVASLVLGAALMSGYRTLSEERERAQVMKVWGRHQDPRLIEVLLAHPEWRGGEGREMTVTVLFADLKDFTKTVEALPPSQALEALNRYLSLLSATILAHGGVVDKYLGDGLMAQWGAPAPCEDHADAALKACLDIEERLRSLTPQLQAAGDVTFGVRLTLHTGPVVAGPLGSDERLEYTIIGDTVNVTSRLQETAKELGCDFLISETTRAALKGENVAKGIEFGRETEVPIRGRKQPLLVFEVLGQNS